MTRRGNADGGGKDVGGEVGAKGERTMLQVGASAGRGRFCNVARAFSAANWIPEVQFPAKFALEVAFGATYLPREP